MGSQKPGGIVAFSTTILLTYFNRKIHLRYHTSSWNTDKLKDLYILFISTAFRYYTGCINIKYILLFDIWRGLVRTQGIRLVYFIHSLCQHISVFQWTFRRSSRVNGLIHILRFLCAFYSLPEKVTLPLVVDLFLKCFFLAQISISQESIIFILLWCLLILCLAFNFIQHLKMDIQWLEEYV